MAQGFPFDRTPEDVTEAVPFPKADLLERFIAKSIDLLIAGALFAFPGAVGFLAAGLYLLISDSLSGGRSMGKRLIGLKTISAHTGDGPCTLKQSIIRNSPFGALFVIYIVLGWIPYFGTFIMALGALALAAFEAALIYTDEKGLRFGDRIAVTQVVDGTITKIP